MISGSIRRERYIPQRAGGCFNINAESPGTTSEQDLRRTGSRRRDHQQRHRDARTQPNI